MERQCTVGNISETKCHLTTYSKTVGTNTFMELEPETREILMWRTGITILNANATICYHHKYVFHKRYPMQQKKCCNPFGLDSSTKKGQFIMHIKAAKSPPVDKCLIYDFYTIVQTILGQRNI